MFEFSKVYCIEDCYYNDKLRFIKGKSYDAKKYLSHDTILIKFDGDESDFIAGLCGIFELNKPEEFYYKYPIGTAGPVYLYFINHFVSGKELRKLKLEKLDENR